PARPGFPVAGARRRQVHARAADRRTGSEIRANLTGVTWEIWLGANATPSKREGFDNHDWSRLSTKTKGKMTFTVAIIGRPNVGKSTLFNRLVGKKLALVDDQPGVTRDRRSGEAKLGDLHFTIIDTAGLEEGGVESLIGRMRSQTEAAIEESDAIFFVMDARVGVTPEDRHFAALARRAGKPLIVIANKAEGRAGE